MWLSVICGDWEILTRCMDCSVPHDPRCLLVLIFKYLVYVPYLKLLASPGGLFITSVNVRGEEGVNK